MLKIYNYRQFDTKKFSRQGTVEFEDVVELVKRQHGKCYVCNDDVILSNWTNRCLYQFSLDRIDEDKPHDSENVLLSCYFCNCTWHRTEESERKLCIHGCHTTPRDIEMDRLYISRDSIQHLRLNPRPIKLNTELSESDILQKRIKHFQYLDYIGKLDEEQRQEYDELRLTIKTTKQTLRKEARDIQLTCQLCSKIFDTQYHFNSHKNRKTPCRKTT